VIFGSLTDTLNKISVLAVITWWYAKSAKRQANAADSQANAAIKHAEPRVNGLNRSVFGDFSGLERVKSKNDGVSCVPDWLLV
jgi:hypothetical protein